MILVEYLISYGWWSFDVTKPSNLRMNSISVLDTSASFWLISSEKCCKAVSKVNFSTSISIIKEENNHFQKKKMYLWTFFKLKLSQYHFLVFCFFFFLMLVSAFWIDVFLLFFPLVTLYWSLLLMWWLLWSCFFKLLFSYKIYW